MQPDDAALVRRAMHGDERAFAALLQRHFRSSYVIALSRCGNAADAEDICQAAFVKAYTRLAQCRDGARFGPWLGRIVRNEALDWVEGGRIRRTEPLTLATRERSRDDPARDAERSELRGALQRAITQLDDVQRHVVLLHDLEGWRHADIAETLDISEMMSRRHLSDARKMLRILLGKERLHE